MLERFLCWCSGTLTVLITGGQRGRFLTLLSANRIKIWKTSESEGEITFCIDRKDIYRCKPFLKKTGCRLYIKQKTGLPFLVFRYRKRKAFFLGILLFFAILRLLSSVLWNVEIQGNLYYSDMVIEEFLLDNGIFIGCPLKKIHCNELETELRKTYTDVGWVSGEVKGTNLILKIEETRKPAVLEEKEPCHLVASRDGIVSSIVTRSGTPCVKAGDQVKKGDILISGIVKVIGDNETEVSTHLEPADGDVYLETAYSYFDCEGRTASVRYRTGRKQYEITFWAGDRYQTVKLYRNRYEICSIQGDYQKQDILWQKLLPFAWSVRVILEEEEVTAIRSKAATEQILAGRLDDYLKNLREKGVLIIENNVKIVLDETMGIASGAITVKEKMTESREIAENEYTGDSD